jgi:hypothetical protein
MELVSITRLCFCPPLILNDAVAGSFLAGCRVVASNGSRPGPPAQPAAMQLPSWRTQAPR